MRIQQENYVEQEQIGTLKEYSSTISEKNLSLVLDNVTKNLYSDPIGAFVRELTSNGVDANKRNSKSEKVKVRIYREGGTVYFEVKDEGKGMTPKVFEEVYMSWFESDKRNDNGQIGGWGIGSKSPLAYTESYELTTIAEGIQYDYEIVRQLPAPTATLLNSTETNKKSGTIVRVEIKEGDEYKLHLATKRQLVYFDNVIVTNELYYYDNHFKILDHPLFMVRSDKEYPFGNEMHIVIGQVAYPIDWHVLGKDLVNGKRKPLTQINVPVGIKFDIGDIPVNLNRETIHYKDDEVKTIITNKILEVKEVLKELYIERLNVDSITKYIKVCENPKTVIELAGYEIYYGIDMRNHDFTLNKHGYEFKFNPKEFHLMYAFEGIDLSKREGRNSAYLNFKTIAQNSMSYAYSTKRELNHWGSLYRNDRIFIRRIPLTRSIVLKYAGLLGLTMEGIRFGKFKTTLKTGAIKQVFAFIKLIEEYLQINVPNYDVVPDSFIEAEKAKQLALAEERKGNITYYDEYGKKTVEKLSSLIDNYQYVFYINRDAPFEEQAAYMQLYRSFDKQYNTIKKVKDYPIKHPRILVAVFSASVINKIKNKKKDLTITVQAKVKGKKTWVSTTKQVNAFLSAETMFQYRELYSQFHILRYTTLLSATGLSKMSTLVLSDYYGNLLNSIPTTPNYRFKYKESNDKYIYPYFYFRKQIDAIKKNRNYQFESAFEEMLDKAFPLSFLGKIIPTGIADIDIIFRETIKKYKLTKLKPHYYGY